MNLSETLQLGIIAGACTFAITFLVTQHSGPFDLFNRLRSWNYCVSRFKFDMDDLLDPQRNATQAKKQLGRDRQVCFESALWSNLKANLKTRKFNLVWLGIMFNLSRFVNELFGCPFCLGPYVSLVVTLYLAWVISLALVFVPVIWFFAIGVNNVICTLTINDEATL